ncbi:UV DNA damage repair endonuclease UvsE [Halalkalibacterium halodurans]|uniref:UV DNA damage endonuclease n=1 Tax=Halalkalibacterium halodurans TaxID=86665 RepID=A0A0M0KIG7_ALKHA|nr:UV DNA damage repair endonuclease UvsE [Halalkalibacterium halodurans]MED4164809.1 UV DNA damage repair endonuclease UvsE [Halalkalibacterium halodurans]TPE69156.1 UV DNA damage repair endonuclease UvsE [Halalkalibacterium halodurans]
MRIQFGYVAMSMELANASPSKTLTAAQFEKIEDHEAGLRKLERIAKTNLHNCLRLLKHNLAYQISFFRLSSKLVPLVNHPLTEGWKYELAIAEELQAVGEFATEHQMRIDFHPDHFVVLNSEAKEITRRSLQTLLYHYKLLKGMGIDPRHRCVLHVGGKKKGVEAGLEQFIENTASIPKALLSMIMLENDDKSYTIDDVLYLGEKLAIPVVLDIHHHDVLHRSKSLQETWQRIVATWEDSPLPVKIHLSSPLSGEDDPRHHDYINADRFIAFLHEIGADAVDHLHVMIEAKKKDLALFQLMKDLAEYDEITVVSKSAVEFNP